MMRSRLPRSVCETTNNRPADDRPKVGNRVSALEWSGSLAVTDKVSKNTVLASLNDTLCLRRLTAAFVLSHSICKAAPWSSQASQPLAGIHAQIDAATFSQLHNFPARAGRHRKAVCRRIGGQRPGRQRVCRGRQPTHPHGGIEKNQCSASQSSVLSIHHGQRCQPTQPQVDADADGPARHCLVQLRAGG